MEKTSTFRDIAPCTMLAPVPSVMVSSCCPDLDPNPNIFTVAWAGTVNSTPPMVSISIQPKRYSYDLIKQSGEFVINLVDTDHCRAMDYCGVKSGRETNKFADLHLTPAPANGLTHAPAIAECPAYIACKVRDIVHLGSHDMFIADVVGIGVQDCLFDADGSMHLERAELVTYNHGVYQHAVDVLGFFGFSVARPDVYQRRMEPYRK